MFTNKRMLTIEWGDCDAAGIVYYPRYFVMFDASTAYLFEAALGYNKREMVERHGIVGFPMVDTGARFLLPSSYGDTVMIESQVENIGRSSFEVSHRLWRGPDLAIEAHEKRVWVGRHPDDPTRLKGVPIPPEIISRLS